jgi:hypothetical protein
VAKSCVLTPVQVHLLGLLRPCSKRPLLRSGESETKTESAGGKIAMRCLEAHLIAKSSMKQNASLIIIERAFASQIQ